MNIAIDYSRASLKFLKTKAKEIDFTDVEALLVSALKVLLRKEEQTIDIKKLKGHFQGYYRVRKGKIRIIFSFKQDQQIYVQVHAIDYRGNVYK